MTHKSALEFIATMDTAEPMEDEMSISKKNARALAVAYNAYNQAYQARDENLNDVQVWGAILKDAQEATGVELVDFTKPWAVKYLPDCA